MDVGPLPGLDALGWALGMIVVGIATLALTTLVAAIASANVPGRTGRDTLRAGLLGGAPSLGTGALLFVLTLFDVLRGSTAYALVRPAAFVCALLGIVLGTWSVVALRTPAE